MHNRAWVALHALLVLGFFVGLKGCGGSEFTSAGADAGADAQAGSAGAGGSAGSGGSGGAAGAAGAGGGTPCAGPEDCNDQSDCTVDSCGLDGTCTNASACQSGEHCCPQGGCGQCCGEADCDDGNPCTEDSCAAGACSRIPRDMNCEDSEYCSPTAGCVKRESCTGAGDCNDKNPCTADACGPSGCGHSFCDGGQVCCSSGCKQCCVDSQCDDGDACTQDVCDGSGTCTHAPKCIDPTGGGSQLCCEGGGCGACCSASDCDDGLACTTNKCVGGACSFTPDDVACGAGKTCDAVQGCIDRTECNVAADCVHPPSPCSVAQCLAQRCTYSQCALGTQCCVAQQQCKECCGDADCNDQDPCTNDVCSQGTCKFSPKCGNGGTNGSKCCGGECRACCTDADCPLTAGSVGCVHPTCTSGVCGAATGCVAPKSICCNLLSCEAVCPIEG